MSETIEILNYKDIKVEKSKYKTINFNGIDIKVYQYIMAQDMLDLINSVLQKSKENGYFSPFKVDLYTHLNIVYLVTDITFSQEDREDELALYDQLESSGLMQMIINALPANYYQSILSFVEETINRIQDYNKTTAAVLNALIQDLPQNAEAAMNFVNSFDPNKYEAVKKFAEAANGGRNISTNLPVPAPVESVKKKPIIIKK